MGRRIFGEFFRDFFGDVCFWLFWLAGCFFGLVANRLFLTCRFEAYDEPWKQSFDTDTQKWESKWGLFDEDRKLKDGIVIPDCDGVTVDKAY
jgi:hypothetical protein